MISIPLAGEKLSLPPALAYLALILTLWCSRVILDIVYYEPSMAYLPEVDYKTRLENGLPIEYIVGLALSHSIGMLNFIFLFSLCPARMRRAFCTLMLRGGFINCLNYIDNIKPAGFFIILFGRMLCGDASYGIVIFLFNEVYSSGSGGQTRPSDLALFLLDIVDQCLCLAVVLLSVKVQFLPKNTDTLNDFTVTNHKEFFFLAVGLGLGGQIASSNFFYSVLISTVEPWWTCIAFALERAILMFSGMLVGASALKLWKSSLAYGRRPTLFQFLYSVVFSVVIKYHQSFARRNIFSPNFTSMSLLALVGLELSLLGLVYYRYTAIV